MKTDINGCSTCANGSEQYETFKDWKGRKAVQYDYRTEGGQLFSCVAKTLEECRKKRDEWMMTTSK